MYHTILLYNIPHNYYTIVSLKQQRITAIINHTIKAFIISGIHLKLNYIKDTLKADAINLGIIQQSSGKSALDSDVVSFSELHEQLGSIQDFQNLCSAIHKKGSCTYFVFITVDNNMTLYVTVIIGL